MTFPDNAFNSRRRLPGSFQSDFVIVPLKGTWYTHGIELSYPRAEHAETPQPSDFDFIRTPPNRKLPKLEGGGGIGIVVQNWQLKNNILCPHFVRSALL